MDASLFISDALHEREVELADGSKHVLHFRELSAGKFRVFFEAERSKDEAVRESSIARLISASVCNPDGTQAMDEARAAQLKPVVSSALFKQILEVNGFGTEKKASAPETESGSGTS